MQSSWQDTATHIRRARENVSHAAMLAGARMKRLQGRELAVGLGGLLAGVVISAALMQPPAPDRTTHVPAAAQDTARPAQADQAATENVPIKIVGTATEGATPCADQTWPYIERHCLTEAPPRAPVTRVTAIPDPSPAPIPEPVSIASQAETTATASASEPRGEPAVTPASSIASLPEKTENPVQVIATERLSKREQRRAERQAKREAARKREEDARQAEASAAKQEMQADKGGVQEPRSKRADNSRASRERSRTPAKRWRELVYDYPDGSRKRVILDGSRSASMQRYDED